MCTTAQAQERGWTGAGGTSDWFGPNNWSTSSIPAAGAATSIGSNTPSGAAPNATVIIGAGTAAQTNTLEIGRTTGATGTLTVERGASLNAGTAAITLGRQGTGFLNIAGGTVSASTLGIGSPNGTLAGGTGVLQINGGVLNTTLTGNVNNIGFETPGSSVLIDGAGSGWNAASDIIVGNNGGSALLTVQNGGMLNVTSTNLDLGLADEQNSTGTLTIDGPGSTVVSGAGITVGIEGTGYVSVLNGATLQTGAYGLDFDYIGLVGQPPSAGGYQSEGHVVVDGPGSSWTSSTGIMVGYEGIGTLTVSNGASVVSPLSYIGAIVAI